MPVKNVAFRLWKQKELELGRTIEYKEIAQEVGLHPETVASFLEDKTGRLDKDVVKKFCKYFDIPAGPISFLVYEPDE